MMATKLRILLLMAKLFLVFMASSTVRTGERLARNGLNLSAHSQLFISAAIQTDDIKPRGPTHVRRLYPAKPTKLPSKNLSECHQDQVTTIFRSNQNGTRQSDVGQPIISRPNTTLVLQQIDQLTFQQASSEQEKQLNLVKLSDGDHNGLAMTFGPSKKRIARSIEGSPPSSINAIQALAGSRLLVPCANLSASLSHAPELNPTLRYPVQRFRTTSSRPVAISLIVWHKDDQLNSPIFTVDARGVSSLREAKQQTETLKGRAHHEDRLESSGSTPVLVIDEATPQDAGIYTCTLEFFKAPTQNHKTRVEVISPPRNMVIRDHSGAELQPGLIGPYDEGSHLELVCQAESGEPPGQIAWWQLKSHSTAPISLSGAFSQKTKPGGWSITKESDLLTTLVASDSASEHIVNLHSGNLKQTLPSSGGHSFRHWTRLPGSKLELDLSPSNLGAEFLCLAANNDISPPLNSSVKINMNLKPTEVKIINKSNYVFRMGKKLIVECQVHGSKPSARVRWFKGSQPIETTSQSDHLSEPHLSYVSEFNRDINNNLTKISLLTLVPQISDNQERLTCQASNPNMPNLPPLSDSIIMNVIYPPQLSLEFGASIKPDSIRLGSDIFMDCNMRTNPAPDSLIWYFNDQPLAENTTAGIIMSNQSLVLQRITIERRGHYQCRAQNSVGRSQSNKVELRPKFEPVCDYSLTKTKYEVSMNQEIKIQCNVLAEPSDGVNFLWKFNKTFPGHQQDSPTSYQVDEIEQFETNFTTSNLIFRPKTKHHFGQLLCSATNSMGKQEKPCVINVVPSELPDPVGGCFFDNLTNSSFSIHCQPPQISSMRHSYLLELYMNETTGKISEEHLNKLNSASTHLRQRQENQELQDADSRENNSQLQQVKRLNSEAPSFYMSELKPDTSYNIVIYVQNSRGRSAPVFYQTNTLPSIQEDGFKSSQVELVNKRAFRQEAGSSLSDKLISYLKVKDYISGDHHKPLIGIVVAVMLCTGSIIVATFFLSRLCRVRVATESRKQAAATTSDRNDKALSNKRANIGSGEGGVQLKLTSPLNKLAGSGSDTSHETNTDSTLILSNRAPALETLIDKRHQQQRVISRQASPHLIASYDSLGRKRMQSMRLPSLAQEQIGTTPIYSTTERSRLASSTLLEQHPNTPQVSIQSDCNSSHELQSDGQNHFQDKLHINSSASPIEPVYVIGHNRLHSRKVPCSQQINLINSEALWPYSEPVEKLNGSGSAGTQISSITTADSLDRTLTINSNQLSACQVIGERSSFEPHAAIGPIPNSVSIPVSLVDCPRLSMDQHRCLSHEYLQTEPLCVTNLRGSYLALAAQDQFQYEDQQAAQYNRPLFDPQHYSPSNYNSQQFIATTIPPPNHHHCEGSIMNLPGDLCTQTIDHQYLKSRWATNNLSTRPLDSRRSSLDGTMQHSKKQHVKFDHQNKYHNKPATEDHFRDQVLPP